ncbi:MAG: hypothetical protein A2527_10825 [Candidatus Lambdaproteobacteria bacterium RIFOXYD2_FULL_50_16]|uniref:Uncharacterized protein n=1 Tax=Candidatus Lambdaproteobacteria bacterium RIFOXYD2_FULL_50_16 TaxID=1817772 RepID=A0A1F6GGD8_9PROT|nr:MAG: hypothetical protein A2527_10825 [Candidatus Lambdaproteobacteria bacterium RIFOXYD2_FULL_50_16]
MKHYYEHPEKLTDQSRADLLIQARKDLKVKPMTLGEMTGKLEIVCFNGSNLSEYVPPGLEGMLSVRGQGLDKKIDGQIKINLIKEFKGKEEQFLAYILSNIQIKEIEDFLEICFMLERGFEFPPLLLTHFSDQELIQYLTFFLAKGGGRQAEFFEEFKTDSWKTLTHPDDLKGIGQGQRRPAILDKSFFSEIQLKVKQGGQSKILQLPLGKLKNALGYFNRKKDAGGILSHAKHSLHLKWDDIQAFKLTAAQSKNVAGFSVGGEFVATGHIMAKNLDGGLLTPEQIDFIRVKVGPEMVDLTPGEITEIELNLDTQQVIFTRGVGPNEYHIARVQKIKLHKEDQSSMIDRVIPFNRGESNFALAAQFLGRGYTEYERAKRIRQSDLELRLLTQHKVVAGDVASQLVLSSLKSLDILPLDAPCVGFAPTDLKNPTKLEADFAALHGEIKELVGKITDLSKSPNFTDHDFLRLTKKARAYLSLQDPKAATPEVLEGASIELKELIKYMDDFFQLNIHDRYDQDLKVEQEMGTEAEDQGDLAINKERLDPGQRDFIGDNFFFFKKRELVQRAVLLVEKMLFYHHHIKPIATDPNYHPDMVIFTKRKDLITHYRHTAYPALCLNGILNAKIFIAASEDEEMQFIQFMRGFTEKVLAKAKELKQSFHHQYKHTLAELTYLAGEQKQRLSDELAFLENPANKEQAYVKLLERIKGIFTGQLTQKEENITSLQKEKAEIDILVESGRAKLSELLGRDLAGGALEAFLGDYQGELARMRTHIMGLHKVKRGQVVALFNPFTKVHGASFKYYEKVLSLAGLFQKALWIQTRKKMLDEVKKFAQEQAATDPARIRSLAIELKKQLETEVQADQSSQQLPLALVKELKEKLLGLKDCNVKGMFQDPTKERGNLLVYIKYYLAEAERMISIAKNLSERLTELGQLDQELFRAQTQAVEVHVMAERDKLKLKALQMLLQDPASLTKIQESLQSKQEVPEEIRKELSTLRAQMGEALVSFKEALEPGKQLSLINFVDLIEQAEKREAINDWSKDLVNWTQGVNAIGAEIEGEQKELEFLRAQEPLLEKVAMSKALPSARLLLKTQYIPLVEREMELLARADTFLTEVLSKQNQIKQALLDGYFRKRHGFPQFFKGGFCLEVQSSTKNHTEKNINAAFQLLNEKYPQGCAPALAHMDRPGLNKVETHGVESIKSRISRIWEGDIDERCLYLPSSISMEEALQLCKFKEDLATSNPRPQKSRNSLVLVYVGTLPIYKLKESPALLESYHLAIQSNVFIDVDGVNIFNNRESIYEALIRSCFGASSEQVSLQVAHHFLNEV